jgi:hypothetical protein
MALPLDLVVLSMLNAAVGSGGGGGGQRLGESGDRDERMEAFEECIRMRGGATRRRRRKSTFER